MKRKIATLAGLAAAAVMTAPATAAATSTAPPPTDTGTRQECSNWSIRSASYIRLNGTGTVGGAVQVLKRYCPDPDGDRYIYFARTILYRPLGDHRLGAAKLSIQGHAPKRCYFGENATTCDTGTFVSREDPHAVTAYGAALHDHNGPWQRYAWGNTPWVA
jgi:hypothetical protein